MPPASPTISMIRSGSGVGGGGGGGSLGCGVGLGTGSGVGDATGDGEGEGTGFADGEGDGLAPPTGEGMTVGGAALSPPHAGNIRARATIHDARFIYGSPGNRAVSATVAGEPIAASKRSRSQGGISI